MPFIYIIIIIIIAIQLSLSGSSPNISTDRTHYKTHTYTLRNKLQQPQYEIHTKSAVVEADQHIAGLGTLARELFGACFGLEPQMAIPSVVAIPAGVQAYESANLFLCIPLEPVGWRNNSTIS